MSETVDYSSRGKGISRMDLKILSRRKCLALLGSGAAATLSSGLSLVSAQQREAPAESELQPLSNGVLPVISSAWDELFHQAQVYDRIPVASRPERARDKYIGGSQITLDGDWEVRELDETLPPGVIPTSGPWVKVKMPAPIQYALMEAGKIPNIWCGDNFKQLQWIQQRDWFFRRRFLVPSFWNGSAIRLRFDGMDYRGVVWLDGELLGSHLGAFGGPTFDITTQATAGGEHELVVALLCEKHDPIPPYGQGEVGDSTKGSLRVVKPDALDAESYQWGNRYRTMGLYQSVRLIATHSAYLEAPFVRTIVIGPNSADLWLQCLIANIGGEFEGTLEARIVDLSTGQAVWQDRFRQKVPSGSSFWEQQIELQNPKLWWPNGMGSQALYRLELKLLANETQYDEIASRFGVRTLEIRRNPSLPDHPRRVREGSIPEDEAYNYLWVANGRPFYAKGACWVTSDDVMALRPQREEWMIRAAKLNGLNLLRLNGGTSILETEQFYNLCDENGLIVWQEAPLNWAKNPGTTSIDVWREQLTQSVLRFRQHPSTGIYVGGNEFDPFANGIEPLVGMVREIFAGYDGKRPFRMNSPYGGDVHAYEPAGLFAGDENWYHKIYDQGTNFISEWSFFSFANMSLLKRMIPATELSTKPVGYDVERFKVRYPTIRDRSAELNYAFIKSWLKASSYDDFAKIDLEGLIECSQMAYARTVGCVCEQWRAQFPYTGGEALWTYNSLGPMAASWHVIDWFGQPQAPFYALKTANRPVHVMADTGFFSWGPGDTFRAAVFALNDGAEILRGMQVTARILNQHFERVESEVWKLDIPANGYKSETRSISWAIPPDLGEGYFFLELTLDDPSGARVSRRIYWLRVQKMLADPAVRRQWQNAPVEEQLCTEGPWLKPQIAGLPTSLEGKAVFSQTSNEEGEITVSVRNTGTVPAYPVRLDVLPDAYSSVWTDNFLWLAPGEEISLKGVVRLDMTGLDPLTNPPTASRNDLSLQLSAWNAPAIHLRM